MPVSTAAKVEALSVDFRSQAALAEILGVSRSRVTRWLKGAGIDPLNAEKVGRVVWNQAPTIELGNALARAYYERFERTGDVDDRRVWSAFKREFDGQAAPAA